MTIAIDAGAQVVGANDGATTLGATISTSGAARVLVALLAVTSNPGSQISSITDTAGLTWNSRVVLENADDTGNHFQTTEIWWAYAATQLTSNVITFTWSNAGTRSAEVFAVSGAFDPTSPWDPGAVLANRTAKDTTVASATTPTGEANSTGSEALSIWHATCRAAHNMAPPTGYTGFGLNNQEPGAGDYRTYGQAGYKVVTGTQTAVSLTDTGGTTAPWNVIVDAIAGGASPEPFRHSFATSIC